MSELLDPSGDRVEVGEVANARFLGRVIYLCTMVSNVSRFERFDVRCADGWGLGIGKHVVMGAVDSVSAAETAFGIFQILPPFRFDFGRAHVREASFLSYHIRPGSQGIDSRWY